MNGKSHTQSEYIACRKTCTGSTTVVLLVMVKTPPLPMAPFKRIRLQLDKTQAFMAKELGMTQSNVWMYENRGQAIPPDVARKLIEVAKREGIELTYNCIYE